MFDIIYKTSEYLVYISSIDNVNYVSFKNRVMIMGLFQRTTTCFFLLLISALQDTNERNNFATYIRVPIGNNSN